MAFGELAIPQASTIRELSHTAGIRTTLTGVDLRGRIVLQITDVRRTFSMAVREDGAGRDPVPPIRWFTDSEIEGMAFEDSVLLFAMPITPRRQA